MAKTQKERCLEFRNARQGEKISFVSFYQTCRFRTEEEMAEAIKPKTTNPFKNKPYKYRGAFPKEYEWYKQQENPWVNASTFLRRIRQWICKEEAILSWKEWEATVERRKKEALPKMLKKYEPKTKVVEDKPDYHEITIRLSKDEADVFRKEYENLLNTITEELKNTESDIELQQANERLNKLKKEIEVFNHYNH